MFEIKEDENNFHLARQRARDLLRWFLFEIDESKITYVGHKEFFKLMFDDHFTSTGNGKITLKFNFTEEKYDQESFIWNTEFMNTEIQSAYLCPSHVFGGEEPQCMGKDADDLAGDIRRACAFGAFATIQRKIEVC